MLGMAAHLARIKLRTCNEKDMKTIMRAHRVKSQIEQVEAWQ